MVKKEVKFLLVEDNDLDAEKLERAFKGLKISAPLIRVNNGIEALNVLRGSAGHAALSTPYIILLDLNMPKMNGLEFLSVIRNDSALKASPVFVLSTSDRRKDINRSYEYNVSGYLVKPFSKKQMMAMLCALNEFWSLSELPIRSAVTHSMERA